MQTTLASAYIAVKGKAAPEVEQAYARAHTLCQQMGDTPQLIPVLQGLRRCYLARAEFQKVREFGEQLLHLAESLQDPVALLEAHLALGLLLWRLGELAEARTHLEQGIALYDRQQDRSLAFRHGRDPGVSSRYVAALVLWQLGYPSQALQRSHEAITLARELSHAYSLVLALNFAADLHRAAGRGKPPRSGPRQRSLCTEQGFAHTWQGNDPARLGASRAGTA